MSSLGMAICVLSDFLGGLLFALFAYALLFKRSWWGVLLGSLCLAGSILVRPTFVFLVPIMPFVAYLAGRFAGRKLRLSHIGVYLAAGLLGILVNDGQERVFQDRLTPPGQNPPFRVGHIRLILGEHFHRDMTAEQWWAEYNRRLSREAGAPYDRLPRGQMVQAAVGLLKEEILAQPMRFAKGCAVNFLKYMFCPVDSLAACASRSFNSPMAPMGALRLALTLLWLPLWLVCLIPQRLPRQRSLYWLAMLCLLAIVALSASGRRRGGAIPVPRAVPDDGRGRRERHGGQRCMAKAVRAGSRTAQRRPKTSLECRRRLKLKSGRADRKSVNAKHCTIGNGPRK